jgi:hypothetical protein
MADGTTSWKRCNTCKGDIPFEAPYYACSVSTCNRGDGAFVFCSVECWDAHVPVLRHRDAWAVEEKAPTAEAWRREHGADETEDDERPARAEKPEAGRSAVPREILVVASKLKAYVRARSGMNTSDAVIEVLSDRLRTLCDGAIARAREAGRKTVLDRDLR